VTDSDRPMTSAPLSAKGAPCPDCGRPWDSGRHCVRATPGTVCGVEGCRRKPLTECFDEAGVRVASVCVIGGKHRWRKA